MWGPLELGDWGPGPNGPVVHPQLSMGNRQHLSRIWGPPGARGLGAPLLIPNWVGLWVIDSIYRELIRGWSVTSRRRAILQRKAKMANDATLRGWGGIEGDEYEYDWILKVKKHMLFWRHIKSILDLFENRRRPYHDGIYENVQLWTGMAQTTHFRWETSCWKFVQPPYIFSRSFTRLTPIRHAT